MIEIRRYKTGNDAEPVTEWLGSLKDKQARARIEVRLARLTAGNFGDCKPLRDSVWELKIDWGSGYRVYTGKLAKQLSCCCAVATNARRMQISSAPLITLNISSGDRNEKSRTCQRVP